MHFHRLVPPAPDRMERHLAEAHPSHGCTCSGGWSRPLHSGSLGDPERRLWARGVLCHQKSPPGPGEVSQDFHCRSVPSLAQDSSCAVATERGRSPESPLCDSLLLTGVFVVNPMSRAGTQSLVLAGWELLSPKSCLCHLHLLNIPCLSEIVTRQWECG